MLRTAGKVFINYLSFREPPKILGRWCHSAYSNTCDESLKSYLANVDNSFEGCSQISKSENILKEPTNYKKNDDFSK